MKTSTIRTRMERGTKTLILLTVFVSSFLFTKTSFAQVVVPPIINDIHSTEIGGNWNDTSTWVEETIPESYQNVEINAPVILNKRDPVMQNLHITTNGSLTRNNYYNDNFYIEGSFTNEGVLADDLTFHVSGDINNTGTFNGPLNIIGSASRTITSDDNSVIVLNETLHLIENTLIKNIRTNNNQILFQNTYVVQVVEI